MKSLRINKIKLIFWLGHLCFMGVVSTLALWLTPVMAADVAANATPVSDSNAAWGYIAAAVSTGLAALAAGYAVANVGSAAIGAITEKPEMLGRSLIIIGLAEGIAIYGLIISILILNQVI